MIIKELTKELLAKSDNSLKGQVTHWAAHYEHRIRMGQKAIYHLEAFVAKFMSLYKAWMVNMMSGF